MTVVAPVAPEIGPILPVQRKLDAEPVRRTSVFQVRQLSKIYHMGEIQVEALRQMDLDLYSGEFLVILGASGSGKSTLVQDILYPAMGWLFPWRCSSASRRGGTNPHGWHSNPPAPGTSCFNPIATAPMRSMPGG